MTIPRRLTCLTLALALGLPVAAQSTDRAATASAGRRAPESHGRSGSAAKATGSILWSGNLDFVTQVGAGFGGADVSEIELGLAAFGSGHQFALGYRVADDFSVPAGANWNLDELHWASYQTSATTTGSITGIYTEYVAGADPNGTVLAGDTSTNRFVSSVWTGVYRVTSTSLSDTQRAIIDVTASVPPGAANLGPGQYWIRSMCDGSITNGNPGPFSAITVPWTGADNAQQEFGLGSGFNPTTNGVGGGTNDYVFWLVGRTNGSGASSYCTQSKATSVPGCQPILSVADLSLATGTWEVSNIPFGPGETNTIGIFIYTNGVGDGQSTFGPVGVPFGDLCLSGFSRSSPACSPVSSSGASDTCSGSFSFSPNCSSGALTILPGDDVNVQCWYRDPPNAGQANFTNAVFYTVL